MQTKKSLDNDGHSTKTTSISRKQDALRFIGSKYNLLNKLQEQFARHCDEETDITFGDLFSGTGAVSSLLKEMGFSVVANDSLVFCSILAKAVLYNNEEPDFGMLMESGSIPDKYDNNPIATSYDVVLNYLNNETLSEDGFIFQEYSLNKIKEKTQRKYFSVENARKIDGIRSVIARWSLEGLISEAEFSLLLSDLIRATNKVANIAGTYGFFLKNWDPRSLKELTLVRSRIVASTKKHYVYNEDANQIVKNLKCDAIYVDPPYTWRHYGAYYHILETIARWDKPIIKGSAGLRPWKETKSRYCYRDEARQALEELLDVSTSQHVFLSYNSDGLISHQEILEILSKFGRTIVSEFDYRKYKSNNISNVETVRERIYYVRRE